MIKNCTTCGYWKLYMREGNSCACMGLSSGSNPGAQFYTTPYNSCKVWAERPSFTEFRKSINIKRNMSE